MNRQTSPNVISYASAPTATPAPQAWVFAVLIIIHVGGVNCGYHVWDLLDQPGKDPAVEFATCWFVGSLVAIVAYALYFRRSWRLTLSAVVVTFAMGAATGLTAVGWHLWRCGWY